jgi:hypothetical protein
MITADTPGATPTPQELELRQAIRPWIDHAGRIAQRRLNDAAAGRPGTASNRLDELKTSLTQHVSDARAHFYRSAFRQHARAGLDPAIHHLNAIPTPDGETVARSTPILGSDYRLELADLMGDAEAELQTATLAGAPEFLAGWRSDYAERIERTTRRMLSDAQIALFESVGQILVKPEFR